METTASISSCVQQYSSPSVGHSGRTGSGQSYANSCMEMAMSRFSRLALFMKYSASSCLILYLYPEANGRSSFASSQAFSLISSAHPSGVQNQTG